MHNEGMRDGAKLSQQIFSNRRLNCWWNKEIAVFFFYFYILKATLTFITLINLIIVCYIGLVWSLNLHSKRGFFYQWKQLKRNFIILRVEEDGAQWNCHRILIESADFTFER